MLSEFQKGYTAAAIGTDKFINIVTDPKATEADYLKHEANENSLYFNSRSLSARMGWNTYRTISILSVVLRSFYGIANGHYPPKKG